MVESIQLANIYENMSYSPYAQLDKEFVEKEMDKGSTEIDARDALHDYHLSLDYDYQLDIKEEYERQIIS